MAISHTRPLLLILSLFFLPASYGIEFEYCNGSGYSFISVTDVEISYVEPNNTTTISIAGSTSGGYISVQNVRLDFKTTGEEARIFYSRDYNINKVCIDTRCPFDYRTFELNIPLFPSRYLPNIDYKIEASLLDGVERVAMCVAMNFPASSSPSISST